MKINGINTGFNLNENKITGTEEGASFGQYMKNALDSLNDAQIKADDETTKLITGESQDIHQSLIAAEEARLQMELTVQIRNKLQESYQEISRMQI